MCLFDKCICLIKVFVWQITTQVGQETCYNLPSLEPRPVQVKALSTLLSWGRETFLKCYRLRSRCLNLTRDVRRGLKIQSKTEITKSCPRFPSWKLSKRENFTEQTEITKIQQAKVAKRFPLSITIPARGLPASIDSS